MVRKLATLLTFLGVMALAASLLLGQAPAAGPGAPAGGGAPGAGGQGGPGGGGNRGGRGGERGGGGAPAIKPVPNKTGLYLVTGIGGNSTIRVTSDGLVVVDTKNLGEANYNQLMDLIKTVSQAPVKFAVVTHVHQDHSGNTDLFIKAGAKVVAHENIKKNLETYTAAAGKPGLPNELYSKDYSIKLGGTEVQVHHYAAGHTSGDSIVYFPDLKVVAMGDEYAGAAANCDYPQGGSILEWAKSLNEVLKLDFDTVIPGHGNDPATKADLQAFKTRLDSISKNAIDLVKKGTAKDQLIAAITAADATANVGQLLQIQNGTGRLDIFYDELVKAAK
jgi:glyoxylase-like metal-dependent hydrolase (beta-lactamase superfamily II)